MDDRTPPGERDVFNLLAAGPHDWVALHSLDLAPWNRGLRTEIDFVVVVPEVGILCIEVKSHENIVFDGHRWYPETIPRSPFKQASDGRHTFFRRLRELAPQFKNIPVVHCCIFPRAFFDLPPNLSIQPWELMEVRAFRNFDTGTEFCMNLKDRMERSIEVDQNLVPLERRLSFDQIDAIVKCCVPVQKRHPEAREEIVRREEEIQRLLRSQQKTVLQLAELNRRVIVSGGAGTGKTLIAMEVARRAAEKGYRVGLLCFNHLVGEWMRQRMLQVALPLPNLIVGRAIRVLAEMSGINIPSNPSPEFWDNEMPQQLAERLTDPDFKATSAFDYLILDEAQDILAKPWLWGSLVQFLSAGVNNGALALFGDFDHQVLAGRELMQQAIGVLDECNRPVRWTLTENCRNYRIVGETAVVLSGLNRQIYSGYLRTGGGVQNYDIFFFEHERAQLDKLAQWLREFKAMGYKPSEITLLSFRADHSSAAAHLKHEGFKLQSAKQLGELTRYSSVHAFKGMENKVVILSDVFLGDQEFQRDLFYTGMTRATESIRVLCDKSCQKVLFEWLSGKDSAYE